MQQRCSYIVLMWGCLSRSSCLSRQVLEGLSYRADPGVAV